MNLPEYRRAIHDAHAEYREQLEKLAVQFSEAVADINAQFLEERDVAVKRA